MKLWLLLLTTTLTISTAVLLGTAFKEGFIHTALTIPEPEQRAESAQYECSGAAADLTSSAPDGAVFGDTVLHDTDTAATMDEKAWRQNIEQEDADDSKNSAKHFRGQGEGQTRGKFGKAKREKLSEQTEVRIRVNKCTDTNGSFGHSEDRVPPETQEHNYDKGHEETQRGAHEAPKHIATTSSEKQSQEKLTSTAKDGANSQPYLGTGGDIKRILFWTPMFGSRDWSFGTGQRPFQTHGCRERRCDTVTDRALLATSDAVIFHMRDVTEDDMPTTHVASQRWVFALKESPWHSWVHKFRAIKSVFNWTMTYRHDSDVPWLYGKFRKKPKSGPLPPVRNFAAGKTKLVAWFVTRCRAVSEHNKYAAELQRHLSVDIFGACGPLKCRGHDRCYNMVEREYKFFLSFENSICRDYTTEKLFHPMNFSVVPVVLGGGDYERHLPPHSYINVMDFPSPYALAQYLLKLDSDDVLYNQYFAWKRDYELVLLIANAPAICDVCAKLHAVDVAVTPRYDDIHVWWNRTNDCRTGVYELLEEKFGT